MTELTFQLVVHLIESTLWSLLIVGFIRFARIRDARTRCWLYRLCLLKFIAPSSALLSGFDFGHDTQMLALVRVVAEPARNLAMSSSSWTYSTVAVAIWLLGVGALLSARVLQLRHFHVQLDPVGEPFAAREEGVLKTALASMERSDDYISGYVEKNGPVIGLYGLFRPRIIARRAFLEALDDEQLRLACQHEIAHRMRRDSLWAVVVEAIACLCWFHPQVWFLRNRIQLEAEEACDQQVMAVGAESRVYAGCLLKAAEFSIGERLVGTVALSGNSLKRRVQKVTQYRKMNVSKKQLLITYLMASAFMALAFTVSVAAESAADSKVYSMSELDEKPSFIEFARPVYPPELYAAGIEATVVIEFVLSADAEVRSAKAIKGHDEYPAFGESAVEAVRQSTWRAGRKDGQAVATRVRMPIKFTP